MKNEPSEKSIRVDPKRYAGFTASLSRGQKIGKTVDALMDWYMAADPLERDLVLNGEKSQVYEYLKALQARIEALEGKKPTTKPVIKGPDMNVKEAAKEPATISKIAKAVNKKAGESAKRDQKSRKKGVQ